MTDIVLGTIIGVGGTIIGVILAGPVTYYFSKVLVKMTHKNAIDLMRRQEFNKAATDFRISFIEEIRFIDRFYAVDRADRDIPEVLAAAADKHETALIIFKDGFLCEPQRTKIEKAWKEYTGEEKLMGKYTFRQYATYNKFKDAENIRKDALSRINALLKFAESKH